MKRQRNIRLITGFISAMLLATAGIVPADTISLSPLLTGGGTIILDGGHTYYLASEYDLFEDTTIAGNGASIVLHNGPLLGDGCHLVLDDCHVSSLFGWAAVAFRNGAQAEIHGGSFSAAASSAIYVDNASLFMDGALVADSSFGINSTGDCSIEIHNSEFQNCPMSYLQQRGTSSWENVSIDQPMGPIVNFLDYVVVDMIGVELTNHDKGSIAIQFYNDSSGVLDDITIDGVTHGILIHSGDVNLSNSQLTCPYPYLDGGGAGFASLMGGALMVRNCRFEGFVNAIQIDEHTHPGTADVENTIFVNTEVSALSAIGGEGIRFYNNVCMDPLQDAIYLERCFGVLERNQVYRSRNTGIALSNCQDMMLCNNYVRDCEHQGIAVVGGSHDTAILNNTMGGNVIANFLIDEDSSCLLEGNILTDTPDADIRLAGCKETSVCFNSIIQSQLAAEIKQGATPDFLLNRIAANPGGGFLNYEGSAVRFIGNDFFDNGSLAGDRWMVWNDSAATLEGKGNGFGPPGTRGLYNNAGNALNLSDNYWGAADGPAGPGGGSGAILEWNTGNGSSVAFAPFAASPAVVSDHIEHVNLNPGGIAVWEAAFGGAGVYLHAKPGAVNGRDHICGALQCLDTGILLSEETFPPEFLPGHLFVINISFPLCAKCHTINLSLGYNPSQYSGGLELYRRDEGGVYLPVSSVQNFSDHTIIHTPEDPFQTPGVYLLVKRPLELKGFLLY